MDLDSSTEQLNAPPTPAASPGPNHHDELKMNIDDAQKTRSPVGVVREVTPHEADSDGSHTEAEKRISADDCIFPLAKRTNNSRRGNEELCTRSTRGFRSPRRNIRKLAYNRL
jgi:hypothetical protein